MRFSRGQTMACVPPQWAHLLACKSAYCCDVTLFVGFASCSANWSRRLSASVRACRSAACAAATSSTRLSCSSLPTYQSPEETTNSAAMTHSTYQTRRTVGGVQVST